MIRDVRVDRANEADVVGAGADVREQLAHFDAALAVLLERERRLQQRAGLALGRHRAARQRLAMVLVEHRLRIEAVDLRQSAVHVEEDHALGARGMVELARPSPASCAVGEAGRRERLAHQAGKREHAEAVADLAERVAARDGFGGSMGHTSLGKGLNHGGHGEHGGD